MAPASFCLQLGRGSSDSDVKLDRRTRARARVCWRPSSDGLGTLRNLELLRCRATLTWWRGLASPRDIAGAISRGEVTKSPATDLTPLPLSSSLLMLSPGVHAPFGCMLSYIFLSLLHCLLARCSVRNIVDQGLPRIVHCEYAMLRALGFTHRKARGGIYVWSARAPGPWVCCFMGCAARAALLRD